MMAQLAKLIIQLSCLLFMSCLKANHSWKRGGDFHRLSELYLHDTLDGIKGKARFTPREERVCFWLTSAELYVSRSHLSLYLSVDRTLFTRFHSFWYFSLLRPSSLKNIEHPFFVCSRNVLSYCKRLMLEEVWFWSFHAVRERRRSAQSFQRKTKRGSFSEKPQHHFLQC